MKKLYKITLSGLLGGHSGYDINKNRGNSCIILANFLKEIDDVQIQNFIGGTKFNVIPSSAEATFYSKESIENINTKLKEFVEKQKIEHKDLKIKLEVSQKEEKEILSNKDSVDFINFISDFNHGIFAQNERKEVTTSINLGVVNLKEQNIKIGMRSSKKKKKKNV